MQQYGRPSARNGLLSFHQRALLFERIASAIGALSLVAGDTRKRSLSNFARKRRYLAAPVAE